jgi:hypothetical protein
MRQHQPHFTLIEPAGDGFDCAGKTARSVVHLQANPGTLKRPSERVARQSRFHARSGKAPCNLRLTADEDAAFQLRAALKNLVVKRRSEGDGRGGCDGVRGVLRAGRTRHQQKRCGRIK